MLTGTQRGVALIIVLWLISLLTIMGLSHARNVHIESRLVANQVKQAVSRAMAEAGLYHAIFQLITTQGSKRARGGLQQIEFESGRVKVLIQNAAGLFDMNTGSANTLLQIFEQLGLARDQRLRLVDAVLDWRDVDDFKHLNGAEKNDYRMAGLNWEPRNAPFIAVDELRYVLGMTDDIFKKVSPYLTVYSGKSRVNAKIAPAWLGSVLGLSGSGSTAGPIQSADLSSIYHITSWISEGEAVRSSVEAIVDISSTGERAYRIFSWKESISVGYIDGS